MATTSLSFLKKLSGQERLPAAAVLDENSESEQYCAICLNDICGGDSYRKLPECRHSFHSKCIDVWLQSHSTCPLCRAQLPQIISLHQSHYEWNDFVSNVLLLIQDFLHKMCNPLNHELSSMLCGNISCIS
ncbi:hypothetical protein C2S52_004290 [Perilla frutescens var. hirtella]|uniref:RING-type domain-containing protein n=1 Tax=Perilla frutescens var. hirtella TaxID=608512 RepID=A0AAD4J398_PERFH|nr:hypothetical protein C2S52_004290 [Perilla frutescens var. hirtella]KAH6826174.1 hypothetical protein C2S53_001611 [Perilla frutescens var. hirtella]